MTDETSDEDETESLSEMFGKKTTDDEKCIWLGMELIIPDKGDKHDPEDVQSMVREWMLEFLKKGGANADYQETGEGVDLIPRGDGWDNTPVYVRHRDETWFDKPESEIGRKRTIAVWFPVQDYKEHHQFDALKKNVGFIIGDEVYDEYGEELEVRGILIAGSEASVRENTTQMYEGADFDEYT